MVSDSRVWMAGLISLGGCDVEALFGVDCTPRVPIAEQRMHECESGVDENGSPCMAGDENHDEDD